MSPIPLDRLSAFNRILIVTLLLGAVLVGFLALHSVAGSHGVEVLTSAPHSHAEETAHGTTSAAALDGVPSGATAQDLTCDAQCALDCALMAMMCVLLLVLTALILLARYPALHHRLLDAVRRVVDAADAARQHIYLPSLTVLSISRT